MADEESSTEGLRLNTPFGPIWAKGSAVFIVIAIIGLIYMNIYLNDQRSAEHNRILAELQLNACLTRLALWQSLSVRKNPGEAQGFDFYTMPAELYYCVPKFVTEQRKNVN